MLATGLRKNHFKCRVRSDNMSISMCDEWTNFFVCLKEQPALWKVKSDEYKDRNKKNAGWKNLLDTYKKIDPAANLDSVKKRVHNIRMCYRRELKKMEKTCKSGAGADEVYTPSLWYFEMLDFLRDQECQSPGISTIDLEDEECSIDEATEAKETFVGGTKKRRTVNQQLTERNNLLREAVHQLKARPQTETKDEAALYSEAWGSTYRKLSPGQQIFARRAIDEVLVLGQLELLTFDSFRTVSRTSSTSSTPQFSPSLSSSPVQYAVHYAPNMEAPQTTTNRTFSRTSSTTSTPQFSPSLSSSPVQYAVHYVPNKQAPQTPTNVMFVVGPEEEAYEKIQQLFDDPKFN